MNGLAGLSSLTVKSDDGFTFVEAIVAIAMLIIVSGALFGLARSVGRTTTRATAAARSSRLIMESDRIVREAARSITPAFWQEASIEQIGNEWVVSYPEMHAEQVLAFVHSNDVVDVRFGEVATRLLGIQEFALSIESDSLAAPLLVASFQSVAGQEWDIAARFGTWGM